MTKGDWKREFKNCSLFWHIEIAAFALPCLGDMKINMINEDMNDHR